jgi:chromosome segregation ATPase
MTSTEKAAVQDGWQRQAGRLTLAHTAVATATIGAAEQVRRRPLLKAVSCDPQAPTAGLEASKAEAANVLKPTRVGFDGAEERTAREAAAGWVLNARRETLAARAARAATADKRIAELESELARARERIALLKNENRSFQSSLDLVGSENSRLSGRLAESDAARHKAISQLERRKAILTSIEAERASLEQMSTALVRTEAHRVKLSFALNEARSNLSHANEALAVAKAERVSLSFMVDDVNKKRPTEANMLNTLLEAMSARAVMAEKMLAETRQRLLACTAESCSVERKFADAAVARDAACKKLELLQKSLRIKDQQVHELEQSRSELIETAAALLKAFKSRSKDLARAK